MDQINTIKWVSAAHDRINVGLVSGAVRSVPWPTKNWYAAHINAWLGQGNSIADADDEAAEYLEAQTRQAKEAQIKALAQARIGARVEALADFALLSMVIELVQAGMLSPPQPGSDMDAVKDIYAYARTKIVDARTKPIAQVEAYDPAADGNFPS